MIDEIKQKIKENPEYTVGALIKLYNLQTHDEQVTSSTNHKNNLGFNGHDANLLTDLSKFYLKKGFLTQKQINIAKPKLMKYAGQLEKEGGIEPMQLSQRLEKPDDTKKLAEMYSENKIKLIFPPTLETRAEIKKINGWWFDKKNKWWTVPLTIASVDKILNLEFELSEELNKWYKGIIGGVTQDIEVPGLKGEPAPYQREAVSYIESRKGRVLIADEQGLGKTFESLAWLQLRQNDALPALIVVPATVKLQWKQEIRKFTQLSRKVEVLEGFTPYKIRKPIAIANYELLQYWESVFLSEFKPKLVIADEAHKIKNYKAKRTESLKNIARYARYFLALTGTPILSRPSEIYTIISIIKPTLFPSYKRFGIRYCGDKKNPYGGGYTGASNLIELNQILTRELMLRRKKEDVLKDLPDKRYAMVPLEITNKKAYKEAEADFISFLRETDSDRVEKAQRAKAITKINTMRQLVAEGKFEGAVDWIDNFISEEKLVLFCHHREIVEKLYEKLKNQSVYFYGGMSSKQRKDAEERFWNDENTHLFIGNITAAGVGLNLQVASNVAFYEYPWTPGEYDQATDRCLTKNNLLYCHKANSLPPKDKGGNEMLKGIKDIQIGDYVIGKSGKWCKVTDKWQKTNTSKPMTKVYYTGWHLPIECTFDHKFLIKRDEEYIWVEAHKLLPRDTFIMPRPKMKRKRLNKITFENKWRAFDPIPKHCTKDNCTEPIYGRSMCKKHYREYIKNTKKEDREKPKIYTKGPYIRIPDEIQIDDDWLFTFGQYIANGFTNLKKGKGAFVSIAGAEYKRPFLERCGKVFSSIGVNWSIYSQKNCNGIELRAFSTELAKWFEDWFGTGAYNKKIPNLLFDVSDKQTEVFLDGYVKGDGYERGNSVEWVSASETLSYQMCLLAAKCGFPPTFRRGSEQSGSHYIGGYTLNKKTNSQFLEHKIRKVETYFEKRPIVYDITVEEDGSFLTGFAIAHNCHRIGQKNAVTIWNLFAHNTIEKYFATLLEKKVRIMKAAVDGVEVKDSGIFNELVEQYKK